MLEIFDIKHAESLSQIISSDSKLHSAISSGELTFVSPAEFLGKTQNWIKSNNSLTYAIICDCRAIGLISLVDSSIGIWLSSEYWGKGIGGKAMQEIFAVARKKGYNEAEGVIEKTNLRSIAMCKKLGGTFTEKSESKLTVKFNIK